MTRRCTCPYCAQRVAVTSTGKIWKHKDRSTGNVCGRSGGRAS